MPKTMSTRFAFVLLLMLCSLPLFAQGLVVPPVSGSPTARPISVVPFGYSGAGMPLETDIAAVVSGDLNRSGQFNALGRDDIVEYPVQATDIRFDTWAASLPAGGAWYSASHCSTVGQIRRPPRPARAARRASSCSA